MRFIDQRQDIRPDIHEKRTLEFTVAELAAIAATIMTMKYVGGVEHSLDDEKDLDNAVERIFEALGTPISPAELHEKVLQDLDL